MLRTLFPLLGLALVAIAPAFGGSPAAEPDEAKALYDHGLYRKSAAECEKRLAANPKDAPAGALLSRIRAMQGDKSAAMKLAEAAAAADAKSAEAQFALAQAYGREAREASVLRQPGLAGKMKKACEAALAIEPNHVDALDLASDFYRFAPGIMGGDKKKSVEYVDRMVKLDPVEGWIKRAEVASDDKDTVRAAESYRKAHEADPASARAAVALGAWLAPSYRDPAMSEKLALAAIQAEPWRSGGWQLLAVLYAYQERWPELEDVLKRSEAAEPSHLSPWYQAGRQLIVSGKDPARAEGYLRHYLSREPEIGASSWAAARWRLGQALEKQGKKSEAVSEMETAVKLDPKLTDAKKDLKRLRG
ncbi:MAG TPA: tetratricopeptide repeat protein [Planctomycetota bacterium]|nr:tetratricopeptide repeat protein [Planctomycetota bacterium]